MIKVFVFHIDLSLTVAMVTENGHQNRLKWTKCHFGPEIGGLIDKLFNFLISAQLNTKKIFKYFMYIVNIYFLFKYLFGICLCSMLTCLLSLQILVQNDIFSILAYFGSHFL